MGAVLFYCGAASFAFGIFIQSFAPVGLPTASALMVIAVALSAVWRRGSTAAASRYVLAASCCLACLALGLVRMEVASWSATHPFFEARVGTEITIEGVVGREPDVREDTTHLYVDTGDETILAITDRYTAYAYGDVVSVTGTLEKPESFVTDLGRTFNYPGYLLARDVAYEIIYGDITRLDEGRGNPIIAALLAGKHAFMRSLEAVVPEPAAGLGEGLLLGEKRALGEELEAVFRTTGIIHVVVLSGYNVMLVVAFVMYVFSYFFGLSARVVFGVLAILAFAILVGLSATVVRACIMAVLLLIARATGRTYAVLRALIAAGVCMLLLNPYLLAFDTGFQLSFLATMGLILVAPIIESWLGFVPDAQIGIREFLVATLATQFFVLPILLYQIGEFSAVSVLTNVLVLPMVPVAMLLAFAAGVLGFLGTTLALPIAYLAYLSLAYILLIATWFSTLPFASFAVPPFPFFVVPIAYAAIAYVVWRRVELQKKENVV